MAAAWAQLLAIRLAFLAGIVAGISGVALLVLNRDEPFAAPATAGGLVLVAWVIFHPRRADA